MQCGYWFSSAYRLAIQISLNTMLVGCACSILEGPSREQLSAPSDLQQVTGPRATVLVLRMEKNRSIGMEADRYAYIALETPDNVLVKFDRANWLTGGFGNWTEFEVNPGRHKIIAFSVYKSGGRGNWVCDGYKFARELSDVEIEFNANETYRLILETDYDAKPIVHLREVRSWPADAELIPNSFTKPGPR